MARVYLKGLPELRRKLEALAENGKVDAKIALERCAELVVAEIKSRAPWAHLVPHIGWTFGVPPKYAQVIGQVTAGGLQVTIYVGGSEARDAAWAEHGTRPHMNKGQFPDTVHPGTPPQPFFFPGWRAKRNEVRKIIRETLRASVLRSIR